MGNSGQCSLTPSFWRAQFAIIAGNGNFILVKSDDRLGYVDLKEGDLFLEKKVIEL